MCFCLKRVSSVEKINQLLLMAIVKNGKWLIMCPNIKTYMPRLMPVQYSKAIFSYYSCHQHQFFTVHMVCFVTRLLTLKTLLKRDAVRCMLMLMILIFTPSQIIGKVCGYHYLNLVLF